MISYESLIKRLESLPNRSAIPLRNLIDEKKLSEHRLDTILAAAELSGDHHRILGFAIGYLHMESQNIPIADTVRMAKELHKPVNLSWCDKRWKQEHDRLTRAVTLKRLAMCTTCYPVDRFSDYLPENFPGYLIRTSVRLGMEGLRQRHCVVSYHKQLSTMPRFAFVVVFHAGKRWTVKVSLTDEKPTSLAIDDIKTRYNQSPSLDERSSIYDLLGADYKINTPNTVATQTANAYQENLARLLPVLRDLGTGDVTVTFDGCGDSGAIDDISFDNENVNREHHVDIILIQLRFVDGSWLSDRTITTQTLIEAIEQTTYDYLSYTNVNWYDDSGGYGEMVISVDEGTVSMDVNVRYEETDNAFYQEVDLETMEEIT